MKRTGLKFRIVLPLILVLAAILILNEC